MLLEKYQLAAVFESILVWNIELRSDLLLVFSPCTMAVEIESQWYSCNSYDSSHPWDRSIWNSSLAAKYLPISCMIFHQQCSFSHNNFHPLNHSDLYSLAPLPDFYKKSTIIEPDWISWIISSLSPSRSWFYSWKIVYWKVPRYSLQLFVHSIEKITKLTISFLDHLGYHILLNLCWYLYFCKTL